MDKRRLSINLVSNLASFAVSILISFTLTPFLVNNLGKELFGFYGLANQCVNYITLATVALNSMASKYITVELVRGNELRSKQYFSSVFFSNVVLCCILFPLLLLLVVNLQAVFSTPPAYVREIQILFTLIFAAMLLRLITSVYGCATYATNRIDLRAYVSLTKDALRIILYLALFKLLPPSIVFVGLVIFALEAYNSLSQIALKQYLIPNLHIRAFYFKLNLVIDTLKIGIWNTINQLGDLLLSSTDLMAANILINESASGLISIVKTMPNLISGVITAINSTFIPRITISYAKGDKNELVREVLLAQKVLGAVCTTAVMLLILFGKDLFDLWVPNNNSVLLARLSVIDVCRMLIVAASWPIFNLNIVMDRIRIPSLLVITSGFLNVIGMWGLIRFTGLGIYAIPLTTLILSILFYGIFIPIYPCRLLDIPCYTFYRPLIETIVSSVIIALVLIPLKALFVIDNWLVFFLLGGISGLISLGICILVFAGPQNIKKARSGLELFFRAK